ncbi:MAG: hypothetical protein ACREHG_06550, partial [Candidatus Saccharimonadales bacterium]
MAVILLIGGASYLLINGQGSNKPNTPEQKINNYAAGNLNVNNLSPGQELQVGQDNLTINGQLSVNSSLVLLPSSQPNQPQSGQLYYSQASNAPYYYNGSQFVSLAPQTHVTSIGGSSGAVSVGNGLQVTSGQLTLSSTTIQSINGQLTNSGSAGEIALITGSHTIGGSILTQNGPVINVSGSLDTAGSIGTTSITAGSSNLNFTADGRNFTFPTSGALIQTICTSSVTCASGAGTAVLLQPGIAQVDTGSGSSVFINNTGGGNLLELQGNGSDSFVVSNSGNVTAAGSVTGRVVNVSGVGAALELNGTNINTVGTLSNVAYLNSATQTFTGNNTFSGNGTAVTVNNDAAINGTLAVGTVNVSGGTT